MDAVVARLSAVFEEKAPTKKAAAAKKVTSEVKDEDVADVLFELEKALSLPNARSELTRAHQGVLERTLLEKVMKRSSAGHMLRELSASCLTKVMEVDSSGLSKVHAALVALAIGKDSTPSLAALAAYGMLAARFGNQFVVSMTDILLLIMKLMKGSEGGADKEVAIMCLRRIYEGTGGPIKSDSGVSTDIIKSVVRCSSDRSNNVRRLAAECCTAVIVSSDDCRELDVLLPAICKCLADTDDEVRYAMAASLGSMLAQSIQLDHSKISAALKKKRKKGMDIRTMEEAVNVIKALFMKAPNGSTRASLAQALVHLIQHARGTLSVSDQNVGAYIAWFFSFLTDRAGKSSGNEREGRQSAACIEYAVREGLLTGLNERALEAAGKQIVTLLATQTKVADSLLNEFQVSVCLEHLSFILVQLGPAVESMDLKDKVSSSFMSKTLEPLLFFLPNPRLWLRIHAAQSVRQLSRAAPTQIANWLSVLYKLVMMQMAEGLDANGEGVMELPLFFSLHGHISALAAIVGIIPESSCGVPVPLIESIFDVCKKLLILNPGRHDAPDTPHRVALIEAGWLLLSALIGLGTEWIGSRLNPLFAMWKNCLGKKPKATRDGLYFELKLRAQSLVALRSFVHVFRHRLTMLPGGIPSAVLKPTVAFAVRTFALLKGISTLEPPLAVDSPVQSVISSIKSVLMDIFAALPPASFNSSFVHVLHMVVSEFTAKSPPLCTELARLLNPADSPLDPECYALPIQRFVELGRGDDMTMSNYTWNWAVRPDTHSCPISADRYGASSTSSSRNGNGGGVGGTNSSPLSSPTGAHAAGLFPASSPTGSTVAQGFGASSASVSIAQGLLGEAIPYSQLSCDNNCDADLTNARECNEDVGIRAVNACIRLFASIYLDQSVAIKEQLVKHFLAIIQKARTMEAVHATVIANISAALLGICKELAQRDTSIKCAPALDLILKIAAELISSPSQQVRRAMGETLGILCKIEGDAFIQRVHKVVEEKLPSKDPITVTGAAFTLGCIHRYVGAMKTMRSLTFTVAALQSVARDFSDPFRHWILHSLWLSIDMGGLSSTSYVQPTLSMLYSHALYDTGVRPSVISQCIGRIIHAVMAALGPELTKPTSSTGTERFLSLWRHLQQDTQAAIQVEVVNVLHQLIVWSSPAVDLNQSFPILQSGLTHSDAAVRRTSLRCLRSWGEKDLGLIPRKNLERRMLDMLDNETNRSLRVHIQRCFESFLHLLVPLSPDSLAVTMADPSAPLSPVDLTAAAAKKPDGKDVKAKKGQPAVVPVTPAVIPVPNPRYRLLDVCKKIVVGLVRLPSEAKEEHKSAAANDDGDTGNDDDVVIKRAGDSKAASSTPTIRSESRWRTRVFALECIKLILHVSRTASLRHDWDVVIAQQSKTKEQFIVLQLFDLVTVGTVASGCTYDPLRICGVQTLQLIINCFENTFDPLSKGQLLLEQYQAQLSTALRQGLSTKADVNNSPQLRVAACHLAVTYLCSGVVTEGHGMDPVIKLLLSPLLKPYEIESWLAQFNGRMRTLVLMSHINALARLHVWGVDTSVTASVTALLSSTLSGSALNKAVKSHPRTRAQVALRDMFRMHTRTLTNYYFNALKDYAVVSSVPRRALTKLTGGYFEGHLATGVREVFDRDWESLLRVCAMTMEFVRETDPKELEPVKVETPKVDSKSPVTPKSHGRNVSVAGSPTGAPPMAIPAAALGMPPLTAATLMLGVTTATLHAIVTSPSPSSSSSSSSSSDGERSSSSGSSRRRKGGSSSSDDANDSKWEKERDDKTVIDSLFALETLMQPKFIRADVVSNETLAEIIPVLGEYVRTAVAESSTIDQQKARLSLSVVCALVRSLSSLASNAGGVATDASPPFELGSTVLHSLAEILSSIVHFYLPAPSSNTATGVLVESFTSLSSEASSLVRDVLTILPSVVALRSSSREDQRLINEAKEHDMKQAALHASSSSSSSSPPMSAFDGNFMDSKVEQDTKDDTTGGPRYLSSALWLCIHVLRVADVELSSLAFTTIGALSASYPSSLHQSSDATAHPIEDVVERLTSELITIANGYNGQSGRITEPLPIAVRIRLLLRSLISMACAAGSNADISYTPCEAAWRASLLINTLLAHTNIHFRMYALEALQSILAPNVRAKVSMFFISQSTPAIITLLQSSLVLVEDGAVAIQFLMALFGRLQDATAREQLLSVVLPLLVARLPVQESVIQHFGVLSAAFGAVLAQHVTLLPTDLRNQLQAYYMRAQQAAATAAASAATIAAAEEEKKASIAAKKGIKSPSVSSSSGGSSSATVAAAADDAGGIKLGINFSRFKK